jgi:hypothetical protein
VARQDARWPAHRRGRHVAGWHEGQRSGAAAQLLDISWGSDGK